MYTSLLPHRADAGDYAARRGLDAYLGRELPEGIKLCPRPNRRSGIAVDGFLPDWAVSSPQASFVGARHSGTVAPFLGIYWGIVFIESACASPLSPACALLPAFAFADQRLWLDDVDSYASRATASSSPAPRPSIRSSPTISMSPAKSTAPSSQATTAGIAKACSRPAFDVHIYAKD